MSLKDIDFFWVLLIFIIAAAIYSRVVRVKTGDRLRDSLKNMETAFLVSGALLFVMWFFVPFTSSLSTFGYPEEVADVDTPEEVLKYLQRYNDAIVRTTDIVKWTLFIIIFWVFTSGYQVVKLLKEKLDNEKAAGNNENNIL